MRRVETAAGVPVRWDGELKGALSVGFTSLRPVLDEDIAVLQAIADLAAVACSNAEAFERERAAARTDSLTGFLNHGAIQVRLARGDLARAARGAAALLPARRPRQLQAGQRPPRPPRRRRAAAAGRDRDRHRVPPLRRPRRATAATSSCSCCRAPTRRPRSQAAQRLRTVVADATARFGDLGAPVTASVGIARWREPLTAGELLDRADRALLLAKRRGKDGLAVAGTATERDLARVDQGRDRDDDPLAGFWDMVSRCERPRHVLYTLSALRAPRARPRGGRALRAGAGLAGTRARAPRARPPAGRPRPGGLPAREHHDRRGPAATAGERPDLARLAGRARGRAGGAVGRRAATTAPAGSYAAIGLARGGTLLGVLLLRHRLPQFPRPDLRTAEVLGGEAVTVLLSQSGDSSRTAVAALAAAIDARDNYTCSHSEDVVGLAREVARRLGLSPVEVSKIRDGAMLHDVGKVAIPNEILYKPGPLTDAEWEVMRQHPVIGESILRRTPGAGPDRAAGAPRARALGRRRLPRRARRRVDPDRQPHHLRLRRLQRDDHRAALPRADVRRGRARRAARRRRQPVRPARGRGAAGGAGRAGSSVRASERPAHRGRRRAGPARAAAADARLLRLLRDRARPTRRCWRSRAR